jgi:hypothetical protein
MTIVANPLHQLPAKGSEPLDKSKDLSIATTQAPASGQNSTDRFEQARMAFFSK